jgi:predicted nucleic acid-binding protein
VLLFNFVPPSPKFNFAKETVDVFLAQIEEEVFLVSIKPLQVHLPDSDDEPFLEVALSGKVEAIVTGNKRHFPSRKYGGVRILSPAEFPELLKERT